MKIPEIKTQIIKNFTKLHQLAYIKPKTNLTVPLWQVRMGNWQASAGINDIQYRKGLINVVVHKDNVEIMKKPFFMWNKWVLKRVNKALNRIIDNYHNYDVVEKGRVPIRVYTAEAIEKLKKASNAVN